MLSHSDFQQVHNHSAGGVVALDGNGLITYANPKAINDYFGHIAYLGLPVTRFFNGPGKPVFSDDEFVLVKGTKVITTLVSSAEFTDASGITLTYWFIRNISALKKQESLMAYLNTATEELSRARDTKGALAQISKLIVPKFATWFSIDLIKGDHLEELVLSHEDPSMIEWARQYRALYPTDLKSDSGTARVAKTGEPSLVPFINEEMIRASVTNPAQLDAILRLNLQSVLL